MTSRFDDLVTHPGDTDAEHAAKIHSFARLSGWSNPGSIQAAKEGEPVSDRFDCTISRQPSVRRGEGGSSLQMWNVHLTRGAREHSYREGISRMPWWPTRPG